MSQNILDLKAFTAFAKNQQGEYCYSDNVGCALSTFLKHLTGKEIACGGDYWRWADESAQNPISPELSSALVRYPSTWTALAARLENLNAN